MSRVALDASALLAYYHHEPGDAIVGTALSEDGIPLVSAVNLSEVVAKLADRGVAAEAIVAWRESLPIEVVTFDESSAFAAGLLRVSTSTAGLSFGDRACLALGTARGCPVLTTDRAWTAVAGDVEVIQVR